MKFINKIFVVLACLVFFLELSVLPIRAAEDQDNSYSFSLSYFLSGMSVMSADFVVTGSDIKFYSFKCSSEEIARTNVALYAFSSSPFTITQGSNSPKYISTFVSVGDSKVYYSSVWTISGGGDLSEMIFSGFPNLNIVDYVENFEDISKNIAEEMAAAGFYDYDDSQWATDRPEFKPDTSGAKIADFGLSDFTFWRDDTFIYASWSGLTDYLGNEDITNDFVFVSAGFLESGSSVSKDIGYYHLADGLLKIPFSKFTGSDTGILSMIKLVPYHYALSDKTVLCKGRSSNEYFNDIFYDDEWGTYYDPDCYIVNSNMSYTKGTSALSGTLSTFMGKELNNGFYSYSSRNMRYLLTWEDVNTTYEADLTLSYMRIDIICNGQEYVFSDSSYPLSSKNIDISLSDILSLLQEKGVQPVIETFSIKYTPYYMVGRKTYHGRSIRFIVEANSAGVLQISQGDDSFENDSDYFDVDIVQPDDLPVVIPGFTDDESFEFDFSYDADNMFKNFFNSLRSLISYCGQIPALINKVFSFLPSVYGDMIVIILAACFIMRLLGR